DDPLADDRHFDAAVLVHDLHVTRSEHERGIATGGAAVRARIRIGIDSHIGIRVVTASTRCRDQQRHDEHQRSAGHSLNPPRLMSLSSSCSVPKGNPDFMRNMRRSESSENQISALLFSEKIPLLLIAGLTTIASNSPAGTLIRSLRSTCSLTGLRSGRKYRLNSYDWPRSSESVRTK